MNEAAAFKIIVGKVLIQLQFIPPFLVGLALVYFIYSVVLVIKNSGDEAKLTESKKSMTFGIVALFIMISLWGLATALRSTFQLDDGSVNQGKIDSLWK